jgi:uncharacterized FlaG/YvyC family protein
MTDKFWKKKKTKFALFSFIHSFTIQNFNNSSSHSQEIKAEEWNKNPQMNAHLTTEYTPKMLPLQIELINKLTQRTQQSIQVSFHDTLGRYQSTTTINRTE